MCGYMEVFEMLGYLKHNILGRVLPSKYGIIMNLKRVRGYLYKNTCDTCGGYKMFCTIEAEDEQWGYLLWCPWCRAKHSFRRAGRLLKLQCKLGAATVYYIATGQFRRIMGEDDLFRK